MSEPLRDQMRAVTLPNGKRALVLDTSIPDGAPDLIREGLARRAIVNSGGNCPCGATWARPTPKPGTVTHIIIEHENDCPAGDQNLIPAIRAWQAGQ